jgi:hypothetical protein
MHVSVVKELNLLLNITVLAYRRKPPVDQKIVTLTVRLLTLFVDYFENMPHVI